MIMEERRRRTTKRSKEKWEEGEGERNGRRGWISRR